MGRVENRGEELSRFDAEDLSFHKDLRQAFLKIAEDDPTRIFTLDASASRDAVFTRILFAVTQFHPQLSGQLANGSG
jgi:dTMP kinase